MTSFTAGDLRAFVLDHVSAELRAIGLAPDAVPDAFDLLAEGVIDSLGLIELLGAVEERFDIHTDLEDLDVEELTVIGPLCDYIYAQHGRATLR